MHTHYDARATQSSRLSPSSWNGATTVLLGNCGVGFAPCHVDQRDMLVRLMDGVEDIPRAVLTEGLPWNWHTFPAFLDALDSREYDTDIAVQVPHAAVPVHIMGRRGADREPATEQDRQRMADLTGEGIRANTLGFATSRTIGRERVEAVWRRQALISSVTRRLMRPEREEMKAIATNAMRCFFERSKMLFKRR